MQSFTIKDIEILTGIKAHTIRIWEQRYPLFKSKRKESLHRIFDNEDLKKMIRIACLYHNGWKISHIASLSETEIIREVRSTEVANNYENYITGLLEFALDFNEKAFVQLLNALKTKLGFEQFITRVCYPYLRRLGLFWATNKVVPGQEHFSSYLIQNKIIAETDKYSAKGINPELILLCPPGEFHEIPLLFMNYLFRKRQRGTVYLGPNVTEENVSSLLSVYHAKYIYLHLITNFTGFEAGEYLLKLCRLFPQQQIVASGEAVRLVEEKAKNLLVLRSDEDILQFVGG